jgi:outer membrane PBP1 activator LpoA protein
LISAILFGSIGPSLSALTQSTANATTKTPPKAAPVTPDPAAQGAPAAAPPSQRFGSGPTTIALIVPPRDGPYERVANSVVAGVRASHLRDGDGVVVEVIETDTDPQSLGRVFVDLRERGVSLALGPLTRDGVNSLMTLDRPPGVPTLALNLPDGEPPAPAQTAFFGVSIETESRQAAAMAFEQAHGANGKRAPRAVSVGSSSRLAQRSAKAFRDEWAQRGGEIDEPIEFDPKRSSQAFREAIKDENPDVVFMALNPEQARSARRSIGPRVRLWSSSMASIGQTKFLRLPELDGLRLLDMPWQVEPSHPAVMAYPKAPANYTVEMQRLYALGIDAFRIGRQIMAGGAAFELDGVTGHLSYDPTVGPRVERRPVIAEYRDGVPVAGRSR